ncbi:hypothetical protein, partial [Idiomarina sp.]
MNDIAYIPNGRLFLPGMLAPDPKARHYVPDKTTDKHDKRNNINFLALLVIIRGIRISWLIFSLACNHRLHFPNGKTGWRGLEQMR